MKVIAAYVASFACYWLGDAISRVMNNKAACMLYPIYNRLMCWSGDVEEWAGIEFMWREPIKVGGTD